jgi:CubicO group peptidase (beta-lactamase class C family)
MQVIKGDSLRSGGITRMALPAFLLFICLVLVSCRQETPAPLPYQYSVPVSENDGWETDSLQAAGLDLASIKNMMDYLDNWENDNLHSILIVRNGKLVFEEYFHGYTFNPANPNNCRGEYILYDRNYADSLCSATKSFTGALTGIAIDQGFIEDVNVRLFSFFPDYSALNDDQRKDRIEIRHLLSNTSGLYWPEWDSEPTDPANPLRGLLAAPDPIKYILDRPMVSEPGMTFNYSGGNTNLLGEIIRRSSQLNADEFSRIYLFGPLGIGNFRWVYFPNGLVYTSGDLYLRPRDMAKFGQLFLDGGMWKGSRLLSEGYVNRSLSAVISSEQVRLADAYGYAWWIESFQIKGQAVLTQSARGWGGQYIFLISEKEMVVVLTAGNYYTFDYAKDIFEKYILPAAY